MSIDELKITDRELQILKLISDEYSTKDIASHLGIAVGTVETHRRSFRGLLRPANTLQQPPLS